MERFLLGICLTLWPATAFAQTPVTIDLGLIKDAAALYSYPNNCAEVCFRDQTLPDTIKGYLLSSLKRDGFETTTVDLAESAGRISIRLTGAGAAEYSKVLPEYLKLGSLGLTVARGLATAGSPGAHRLWRYNWRYFLPHGVAMVNHRTVQLLHFPPDTVLMETQNYLAAETTKRWAKLLLKNDAPLSEVDRFQNIIDVLPIAAPEREGQTKHFNDVYSHFDDYVRGLLDLWLPRPGMDGRPLVVMGGPARQRLKAVTGVDLPQPLELRVITLKSGTKVPALAANHPSRIWHAKDDDVPKDEQLDAAMGIMKQDLIAACWQVKMGMDTTASAEPILSLCKQTWSGRDKEICVLSYTQVFGLSENDAQLKCGNLDPNVIRSVGDKYLTVLPE